MRRARRRCKLCEASPQEVPLREFLELRINELQLQMQRRLEDIQHRIDKQTERGDEQLAEVKGLLEAARQESLRQQRIDQDRTEQASKALASRLDGMNDLRRQIEQERALYVDRDRLDAAVRQIDLRLDEYSKRMEAAERARANLDGRMTMLGGALFAASVIMNLTLTILSHLWGHS